MQQHISKSIFAVIHAVADITGLSPRDFIRRDRRQHIAHARHLVIYSVRYHFPKLTYQEIGSIFDRKYNSILNSLAAHSRLLTHDLTYQTLYQQLQQRLAEPSPQ